MSNAKLVVKKPDGSLLYDTENISYGLVKSGYLTFNSNWRRWRLRAINVDPNLASSWVESGVPGDNQFGFTIDNPQSPIVFLVGRGTATGVTVSGSTKTYLYAGASTATKYYCFDLMRNDGLPSPWLKTRSRESGQITFNSNQNPMNVVASIRAPDPGPLDRFGRPASTYTGGRNERIAFQSQASSAIAHSLVDINLDAGTEYAAFLPWNRSCGVIDGDPFPDGGAPTVYGMTEGAFGRIGGISFFFAPPGRTTEDYWPTSNTAGSYSYMNLPTSRFPSALVIKTAGLPFPFN